jgi:hypothetical protein
MDHHSEFKFRDVSTSLDMTNETLIRCHPCNPWLILKSKAQHFDRGGDLVVLVAGFNSLRTSIAAPMILPLKSS